MLRISYQVILVLKTFKFFNFGLFESFIKSLFNFVLVLLVRHQEVRVHMLTFILRRLDCLVQEYFHLFLKESVKFRFKLFFLNLVLQTIVIYFLVELFNCESEDSFFKFLSQKYVSIAGVELN